jgi:PAS domain S-box-containing protein
MSSDQILLNRIQELEELLEVSERKADILTNLLKEASSEFRQALEKVTISETNFRSIFENAPEAIYIVDPETQRILDCNSFTIKWLGYSRQELLAMQVEDILVPGSTYVRENIQKAIDNGLVHIQERQFQKKDRTIVDAEINGTWIDYQGKKSFVALVRDITERKRIEELLRYKELFESVSDPVFINDSQGRFLEFNDVVCDCFGYPRHRLLQMSVRELTKPVQHQTLSAMAKAIQKGNPVQFELEILTKMGVTIPFEFHARRIYFKGQPAVLSVARNLSLRKKMEEALIKTERLSAVGEMASGVAHNFNNLLQMIMGSGEAALAKLDAGKIRGCREAIGNILNASGRGADVVRRIKDFTLVKNQEIENAKVFDLEELITEAVQLTKPLWKDISGARKYRLNFVRCTGCFVKGRPSELYEVLVNLIKNALEAMPRGGVLTFSTYLQNGKIHLTISDTGQGIQEDHFQRIFEPFFTTKGSKSSGLGLASCYGIVKRHQGDMHVQSSPGEGTAFTVILPVAQKVDEQTGKEAVPSRLTKIRFLVIDDEINILKAIEMFFEDSEIEILTAQTVQQGLKFVYQNSLDMILCDLGMDDMNGLQVGKEIKKYYQELGVPKIPFLLYTGLDEKLDAQKLAKAGVDRVVNKPIPFEDLLNIIQEVVSSRSCSTA